jgi:hypothetical protein
VTITFETWLTTQRLTVPLEQMHIQAAFEVLVSRLSAARARGATEPMTTASTRAAGPNSRAATRRMLENLGYSDGQRRIVHRLLVGSPSGWPGLLKLYAHDTSLNPEQRQYVLRQARSFTLEARRNVPPKMNAPTQP